MGCDGLGRYVHIQGLKYRYEYVQSKTDPNGNGGSHIRACRDERSCKRTKPATGKIQTGAGGPMFSLHHLWCISTSQNSFPSHKRD